MLQTWVCRPLLALTILMSGAAIARGQGCGVPRCAPNPVPCAHCTGTWTDNYGFVLTITSNNNPPTPGTYAVTGTWTGTAIAPGCPAATYQVSGTLTQSYGAGTASLSVTGSSPSPSGACLSTDGYTWYYVDTQYETVAITNDSCDYASGTWSNSIGGMGSITMTKPTDLPELTPAQSTAFICWWDAMACGPNPNWPVVLFEDTLQSAKDMAGRQVYESQGGIYDGCWFPGTMYPYTGLSGGGWFVGYYYFDNRFDFDYVGVPAAVPGYIRTAGMTPCYQAVIQNMSIYSHTGSPQYYSDTIFIDYQPGWFGVQKNGVTEWRTY
jgi:hypothetical protein